VEDAWGQLRLLYSALCEDDVVRGLVDRTARNGLTRSALEAEMVGDDEAALQLYTQGTELLDADDFDERGEGEEGGDEEQDSSSSSSSSGMGESREGVGKQSDRARPTDDEVGQWEDGLLDCLSRLGRWNELDERVMADGDSKFDNLWDPTLINTHVRHNVRAALRLGGDRAEALGEAVRAAMAEDASGSSRRWAWMREKHALDMAAVALSVHGEQGRCGAVLDAHAKVFCQQWPNLHRLSPEAARGELRSLQRVAELRDCLGGGFNGDVGKRWRGTWPRASMDGVEVR
jgi:hypothetical protein